MGGSRVSTIVPASNFIFLRPETEIKTRMIRRGDNVNYVCFEVVPSFRVKPVAVVG